MRPPLRSAAAAGAALLFMAGLTACSSATAGDASTSASAVSPSASASAPSASATPAPVLPSLSASAGADTGLPPEWPAAIPGYAGGRLLSATVSTDGRNVNAAWASDTTADEAWSAMDARLRAAGYRTFKEAGREDQLVQDENQRSDNYVSDSAEVNLVVIPGKQSTVLINGSLT